MKPSILNRYFTDLPSRCFLGLMFLYGLVILFTFQDYGINPDEQGHISYGRSVVNWYLSGFQDRQIFSWTNTWLYGGFFDTIMYLVVQASPLNTFDTRHLCTSAMGALGVLAAYRIGCLFGSKWAGVLAALFLILTPRYYGHAFNNHKDIPFAVLYLWSVYWQLKVLRAMPNAPWSWVLLTGCITGMTMGIRVGGVMLLCFAGAFWIFKGLKSNVKRCTLQWLAACGVAYVVMLLFWPWAQTAPLSNPWQALTAFSQFSYVNTDMLFEGQYLRITEIPWYYAPKWLLLTLPEFVLLGLIVGPAVAIARWQTTDHSKILEIALLAASGFAPLFYLMWSKTPLYDGVRHILFIILPLAILSALAVSTLIQKRKPVSIIAKGIVCLFMVMTVWEMVALHPNQYVYFNRIFAKGIEQAHKHYVTDYWNNSYKKAAQWLASNAAAPDGRKVRIHNGPASTRFLLDPNQFEAVTNPWASDYFLVSTRYENHRVVSGDVMYVVRARTVPLLYIMRPNSARRYDALFSDESTYRWSYLGWLYRTSNQDEKAQGAFERGLILDPENANLHLNLGDLLLESGNPQKALTHFQKAYDILSLNAELIHKMGRCYEQLDQPDEAQKLYTHAIRLRPYFNSAYRSLGQLLQKEKQYKEALVYYQKIVDILPTSLGDWHQIGMINYHLGNLAEAATAWQTLVSQDPTQVDAWLNLGLMLYGQGKLDEALKIYNKVRVLEPDNQKAVHLTGKVLIAQKRWDQAIELLTEQITGNPLATESYLLIAQAHRHKNDIAKSQDALAKYIKAYSDRPDGWIEYFELGKLYRNQGQPNVAQVIYQAALKMLPNNTEIQDSLRALSH